LLLCTVTVYKSSFCQIATSGFCSFYTDYIPEWLLWMPRFTTVYKQFAFGENLDITHH
jgi:hypothetical protein